MVCKLISRKIFFSGGGGKGGGGRNLIFNLCIR